MNHLRSFNEEIHYNDRFEKFLINNINSDILNDIEDICLELEDSGISVYIEESYIKLGKLEFILEIYRKIENDMFQGNTPFNLDDSQDSISRLVDYMDQHEFTSEIFLKPYRMGELLDVTNFYNDFLPYQSIHTILNSVFPTIKPDQREVYSISITFSRQMYYDKKF